ncbi:MAG: hypothetical protein LBJ31_03865 [Treponema sp.]|jgi:hypothetical protein|nr:hypothetical protein [Treponema sp.]
MKWIVCVVFLASCLYAGAQEAAKQKPALPLRWSLLWSGSWEYEKNMVNKGEFGLSLYQLRFRLQYMDRRTGSFSSGGTEPVTGLAGGLYHEGSGTRLLYGKIQRFGLAARTANVWQRGAPYADSRTASGADLRTSITSTTQNAWYAYLGMPFRLDDKKKLLFFGSLEMTPKGSSGPETTVTVSRPENPHIIAAGAEYEWGARSLRAEGLYVKQQLAPRAATSWFSTTPALPSRESRLFGGGVNYRGPFFGLAADMAYSETFAFGRDWYGNIALRLGNRPWKFQAAFDSAGSRFVDTAGAVPGAGFRSAFRLERSGKSTSLFRAGALFRGSGPEYSPSGGGASDAAAITNLFSAAVKEVNRHTLDVSYRFPLKKRQKGLYPIRLAASWAQDRRERDSVLDTFNASAALGLSAVQAKSEGKLIYSQKKPNSWSAAEEISYRRGIFRASIKTGYAASLKKERWNDAWNTQAAASLRWKGNRLSLKAASADFPRDWSYTVSWTFKK